MFTIQSIALRKSIRVWNVPVLYCFRAFVYVDNGSIIVHCRSQRQINIITMHTAFEFNLSEGVY
jgi:hypothetical protein